MLRWLPTAWQYGFLKRISPGENASEESFYKGRSKLNVQFGQAFLDEVRGKVVIDFGCGEGAQTIELAKAGACLVIGLDIREEQLERARMAAQEAGVSKSCQFATSTSVRADIVVSLDSFEHFEDPGAELRRMHGLLKPGGILMASFGPTWYHPLGGHLFSVFPWAHLVFSERALIRWRSDLRDDGATSFSEVSGGLNKITIRRFCRLVDKAYFRTESIECVPIRNMRWLHNRLTREWTTAVVRARLRKTDAKADDR